MRSDVERWLEGHGLGKHAVLFAEHLIDFEVLPELTEDDLRELGLALGDRKKLLKAVRGLGQEPPATSSEPSPADAERRRLTVMFCDLMGSTELSQKLDPEDYRDLLTSFQDACAGAVKNHQGHVAKHLGDGLLAYFGYPQAHEDDAEQAARAGLAVVSAVGEIAGGEPLNVRVGIATGLAVVGDIVGDEMSEADAISGDTPNLAARLQGFAGANMVVVGERTYALLGEAFECEALSAQRLKGVEEPFEVWRVMAERHSESRFETRHTGIFTPFVGRRDELDLLTRRWDQALTGEGQAVLISGEAGIGKSRIAELIHQLLPAEGHLRLLYQCSPHHTNSALYPVIEQLNHAAGLGADETDEVKLDKLETLIAQASDDVSATAPLFADLLSIRHDGRYPALNLTPQAQKERTLEALVTQLLGLAARTPVLFVFEDLHWADPTTRELLDLMVAEIEEARVLALLTFRPEYEAPWVGQAHTSLMALTRLAKRQCGEMVRHVAANAELPEEVMNDIVAKTDGVPLFVEELTKTMMAGDSAAVPATIQASLTARLDRLGPAREVAQVGAVMGRTFAHDLLASVSDSDPQALGDALVRLVDAELLFQRGTPPDARYTFKHALVQDAAYESLLKGKRQQLHGRIANVLEGQFPERSEAEPELLAHHFTEAGAADQAVAYWRRAGDRALERSAFIEATAHLTKGLEQLAARPDSGQHGQQELALQAALASALAATEGYAAAETGKALMRARELCREVGDTQQLSEVLYGVWAYFYAGGDCHAGLELAEECFELVRHEGKRTHLMAAHSMLGQSLASLGRFDMAQDHLEKSIALYEPEEDRSLALVYADDPALASQFYLTIVLWLKGFPEQAIAPSHDTVDEAEALSHAYSRGLFLCGYAVGRCLRREPEETQEIARAAIDFSTEQNIAVFTSMATLLSGWALAESGQPEEGIAQIRRGVAGWTATGAGFFTPLWLAFLAAQCHGRGKFEEGLEVLNDAFDAIRRNGEDAWTSELERLRGDCLLSISPDNIPEAETSFRRAIEVAKHQNARSLELRAATSLARLWRNQDKTAEAHDLLAPVYGWFTEGFDTADLKDAKALLEELS